MMTLPGFLSQWISLNMGGVGDPAAIRFKSYDRVPFWWLPGNGNVRGLTLWRSVYLTPCDWPIDATNRNSMELLFHELVHVEQFRRQPALFPIRYLLAHLRHGYLQNPFEIEARERAARLTYAYFGGNSL